VQVVPEVSLMAKYSRSVPELATAMSLGSSDGPLPSAICRGEFEPASQLVGPLITLENVSPSLEVLNCPALLPATKLVPAKMMARHEPEAMPPVQAVHAD